MCQDRTQRLEEGPCQKGPGDEEGGTHGSPGGKLRDGGRSVLRRESLARSPVQLEPVGRRDPR